MHKLNQAIKDQNFDIKKNNKQAIFQFKDGLIQSTYDHASDKINHHVTLLDDDDTLFDTETFKDQSIYDIVANSIKKDDK